MLIKNTPEAESNRYALLHLQDLKSWLPTRATHRCNGLSIYSYLYYMINEVHNIFHTSWVKPKKKNILDWLLGSTDAKMFKFQRSTSVQWALVGRDTVLMQPFIPIWKTNILILSLQICHPETKLKMLLKEDLRLKKIKEKKFRRRECIAKFAWKLNANVYRTLTLMRRTKH